MGETASMLNSFIMDMSPVKKCPDAPRKPKLQKVFSMHPKRLTFENHLSIQEEEEYRAWVRPKLLLWRPEMIDDMDEAMLQQILKWYRPSSQPRNLHEHSYCDLMAELALKRMYKLNPAYVDYW